MTCAELLDTLIEQDIDLMIDVQPRRHELNSASPEVRFLFQKTVGIQRYVYQGFISKEHLEEVEDQRYKESVFERMVESGIEMLKQKSVTRPD